METGHGPKAEFYQHEGVGSVEAEGGEKARQEGKLRLKKLQMAVKRQWWGWKTRQSLAGWRNSQAPKPKVDDT